MENLVKIANIETPVVEYSNQPVVTTEQLAEFYGCEPSNIKKNFNANTSRFIAGKHFFKLEGDELKNLRVTFSDLQISSMTRSLMLWTKQGAARHSKMLGTDRAWDMFDLLEENYFNQKQEPKSQIDILVESAKALQRQERELARLKLTQEEQAESLRIVSSRVDTLNCVCTEGTKRQKLVAMVQKYAISNGLAFNRGWHDFRQAYNTAFHTNLKNSQNYYCEKQGIKKISTPDFLERKGYLDDAMRIMDKLLAQRETLLN